MTEDSEMLRAWRAIRDRVDFSKQPIWSGIAPPKFTATSVTAPVPTSLETRSYDFTIRKLEDRGGIIARGIFGRKSGDAEWLPVEQIT